MTARTDRSGFTLVETMVASSIALIVLVALVGTFLFCQRMFRLTMAEAESALAMRELRDKLLFRAGPELNGGLLTGRATADNTSITMDWTTLDDDAANDKPDRIKIVWRQNNFFNDGLPHTAANLKWFIPGGFLQQQTWAQTVDLPRIRIDLASPVEESARQTSWILLPQ
ncbi:MAG: prepilin-type N-terminal cleavage/methylation domain-containing protein [Kiritimatiellae bacterium]|nr:prepilin-type N-terminal cleavage/methylation domain-containing protein [Kiritimatiellia bacterium]